MDIAEPYATLSKKLTETLKRNLGEKLVSVALFGSVARGEAGPDSDLDILVICEDLPRSRLSRTELFLKSEKELDPLLEKFYEQGYGLTISPVILTPEEARQIPALFLDMTEDAVILFDRENFLSELLEKLRAWLRDSGAERVWLGRGWYWRLWKVGGVRRVKIVG